MERDTGRARAAAARGLAQMNTAKAVPLLVAQLGLEADESVRVELIRALAGAGEPSALAALAHALADEADACRAAAVEAIGTLGHSSATQLLLDYLVAHRDDPVAPVLGALRRCADKDTAEALLWALGWCDADELVETAQALARLDAKAPAAKILMKRRRPSGGADAAAIRRALRHVATVEEVARTLGSAELLAAAKARGDEDLALAATRRLRDDRVLAELAMTAREDAVRLLAVSRMGRLDRLREVVDGARDVAVRLAAVQKIRDEAVLDGYLADHYPAPVRAAAAAKLGRQGALLAMAREARGRSQTQAYIDAMDDACCLLELLVAGEEWKFVAAARRVACLREAGSLPGWTQPVVEAASAPAASATTLRRLALKALAERGEVDRIGRLLASSNAVDQCAEALQTVGPDGAPGLLKQLGRG